MPSLSDVHGSHSQQTTTTITTTPSTADTPLHSRHSHASANNNNKNKKNKNGNTAQQQGGGGSHFQRGGRHHTCHTHATNATTTTTTTTLSHWWRSRSACGVTSVVIVLLSWFSLLWSWIDSHPVRYSVPPGPQQQFHPPIHSIQSQRSAGAVTTAKTEDAMTCVFRHYGDDRSYHLHGVKDSAQPQPQQPSFLTTDTEYIYGAWPVLMREHAAPSKLCVDQTEWLPDTTKQQETLLPFADGTNPSLLTLDRLEERAPEIAHTIRTVAPTAHTLVTVCMTNSQCTWPEATTNDGDPRAKPWTIRTVLQVRDVDWTVLYQTTLYLIRDAPWGRQWGKNYHGQRHLPALDDARLFVHDRQMYVSYREGKGFGYESQVLNPVHVQFVPARAAAGETARQETTAGSLELEATLLASETSKFCCGRNMALLSDLHELLHDDDNDNNNHEEQQQHATTPQLHSLTWVDPVTVIQVDTTPLASAQRRLQQQQESYHHHRRLAEPAHHSKQHKSHIHGTNAFMVRLPDGSREYLGVAHFHRPNDRKPNPYARFGHHYTHAFYTVSPAPTTSSRRRTAAKDDTVSVDFDLIRLSPEFVLPSAYDPTDADLIQFVSGLEIVRQPPETAVSSSSNEPYQVLLAYGVNDCEAAVTSLDLSAVLAMLRPVAHGQQVVDFMLPLVQDGTTTTESAQ